MLLARRDRQPAQPPAHLRRGARDRAALGLSVVLADGPLSSATYRCFRCPTARGRPPQRRRQADGARTECLLLQTSRFDRDPEGVLLSYANVVDNYDRTYRWVGATGADVLLMALPLYNTYGSSQGINLMAVTGATLVLPQLLATRRAARAPRRGRHVLPSVPTMMTRLQAVADGPITDRVVRVGVGAARRVPRSSPTCGGSCRTPRSGSATASPRPPRWSR
ncbi:AMP-binding protein [Pseudonocardia sp. MCCB 268]|nr:AMP-binding protein [Pseudonocardia cytotoxica]